MIRKSNYLNHTLASNDRTFFILLFEFRFFKFSGGNYFIQMGGSCKQDAGLYACLLLVSSHSITLISHNMSGHQLRGRIDFDEEFDAVAEEDSDEEEQWPPPSPDYPERGIWPHTKALLIEKIDLEGGIGKINRSNKLLDSICDNNLLDLGEPGSELRKRVKTTVAHWKRSDKLFLAARKDSAHITVQPKAAPTTVPPPTTRGNQSKRAQPPKQEPTRTVTATSTMSGHRLFSSPDRTTRRGGSRKHRQIGTSICFFA